jgi:hypothetical protein
LGATTYAATTTPADKESGRDDNKPHDAAIAPNATNCTLLGIIMTNVGCVDLDPPSLKGVGGGRHEIDVEVSA